MYRRQFPEAPGMHTDSGAHLTMGHIFENLSILPAVVGLLMLLASSGVVLYNEGRAVQTARSLEEALARVVRAVTLEPILENSGKLLHVSTRLRCTGELTDTQFGLSIMAARLQRSVEMFQWVEHEHRSDVVDGEETREEVRYSYTQEWVGHVVNSNSFDNNWHRNPTEMPVEPQTFTSELAYLGHFHVTTHLLEKLTTFRPLTLTYFPSDSGMKLLDGYAYAGYDPAKPEIGDVKVKFSYAGGCGSSSSLTPADDVSIMAKQQGETLVEYPTNAGDVIAMVALGNVSPEEMIRSARVMNSVWTWVLRSAGWLLSWGGAGCLATHVRRLGLLAPEHVRIQMQATSSVRLSLVVSISASLTFIAAGWLAYRPVFGIAVLFAACLPAIIAHIYGSYNRRRTTAARREA